VARRFTGRAAALLLILISGSDLRWVNCFERVTGLSTSSGSFVGRRGELFSLKECDMGLSNTSGLPDQERTAALHPIEHDRVAFQSPPVQVASKDTGQEIDGSSPSDSVAEKEAESPQAPSEATPAASPPSPDAVILAQAQQGNHAAFAQLYSLHKRRVYSLCLRMLGNVAEAEDLTQEAFLQLHRKIGTFRGDSAFSTWLHRLTINVVLMHLRRKGLNLISLDEALDPAPDHGANRAQARSFGAPDLRLTGSIDRMTLEKAVEDLPAGYRLIFVLHDIEGYEHNEIAALLDCSIGNSKSQLHKARMKLREALRAPADEVVTK
jgi:RNA polymerase sigma-70 factor (ECF subfamily)